MALVFNRNKVGVENTTINVGVPNDPVARLMYYLNCMCTVLSLDQMDHNIMRLTNYQQFHLLSDVDKALLLILCAKLNPVVLTGQCLFLDEDVSENTGRDNEFYSINTESLTFAAVENVFVGEKRVAVKKVMFYNSAWLNRNYLQPMDFFLNDNDSDDSQTTPYIYQQPPVTYNQRPAITYNQPQTAAYNQRPAITYNQPQTDTYNQRPAITYNQPQTAAYSPTLAHQQATTYTQPSYQLPYHERPPESNQPQTAAYSPTLAHQQAPTYTQPSYQLPYQQSSSDSSGCCVIL